jgi:hypothetical protein
VSLLSNQRFLEVALAFAQWATALFAIVIIVTSARLERIKSNLATDKERETRKRIEAAERKVAPRHLSQSQMEQMAEFLRPAPRGRIDIIVPLSSGDDALAFAEEIAKFLRSIGFTISGPVEAAYTPMIGFHIQVKHGDDRPQLGGFLQGAFRTAGYKCDGAVNADLSDDIAVELIVGSREHE